MKKFCLIPQPGAWQCALFFAFILFPALVGFSKAISLESYENLRTQRRMLTYVNPPSTSYSTREIQSLDEAIAKVTANIATQRYMRDSLGLRESRISIEVQSESALVALRNQIVTWLDSSQMRYGMSEDRGGRENSLQGLNMSLENILKAEAYFDLRDSLMSRRSNGIRVKVDEMPYREELDPDSLRWFLQSLRALEMKSKPEFERYFLKTFLVNRHSMHFVAQQGMYCQITLKLPAPKIKVEEGPQSLPRWMLPFRHMPWVLRMEYVEALILVSLALGATSLVLTLAILATFLWKRREKSRKAKE